MTDFQMPTLLPLLTPPIIAGATAYAPLPVEPFEERTSADFAGTKPAPRPVTPPSGPAYPSLPVEPDTRDGGGGGTRV